MWLKDVKWLLIINKIFKHIIIQRIITPASMELSKILLGDARTETSYIYKPGFMIDICSLLLNRLSSTVTEKLINNIPCGQR